MARIAETMGGKEVIIQNHPIGYINKDRKLVIDPYSTGVKNHVEISISDLEDILAELRKTNR